MVAFLAFVPYIISCACLFPAVPLAVELPSSKMALPIADVVPVVPLYLKPVVSTCLSFPVLAPSATIG